MKRASILIVLCLYIISSGAQTNCPPGSVNVACLGTGDLNDYQCIGDSQTPMLASNIAELLPAAQALTTPQKLIVVGEVIFEDSDYEFASGSELIFLSNGSFTVNNMAFSLRGTHLHGCEAMWTGISGESSTFLASDCTFEHAERAINLGEGSSIEVTGSVFNGNMESIVMTGNRDNGNLVATQGDGISDNTFNGDLPLLGAVTVYDDSNNSHTASWPFRAIRVSGANTFDVGGGRGTNVFQFFFEQPFNAGVLDADFVDNLLVANSRFENLTGVAFGFRAIEIRWSGLSVDGNDPNQLMFDNCGLAVFATNSSLDIRNVGMDVTLVGVLSNLSMQNPISLINNKITASFGASIVNPWGGIVVIDNNEFTLSGSSSRLEGVVIVNSVLASLESLSISNNSSWVNIVGLFILVDEFKRTMLIRA